jgi:membrane protease YdiL (CAAX protease family)
MFLYVIIFYILIFLFTFILGGIQQATGLDVNISLPQWGPGIAALVTLIIFSKKVNKPNFSFKGWKLKEVGMAILVPLTASLVIRLISRQFVAYDPALPDLSLWFFLWIPLGALGEELGWRGFLQSNLDRRLSGWLSCLVVGLLWVPFHVQLLQNGVVFILFFALLLIAYSTVLYVIMRATHFNVWIAALFHAAINFSNLLYFNAITNTRFMAINALVWASIAIIFIILKRDLFLSKKE